MAAAKAFDGFDLRHRDVLDLKVGIVVQFLEVLADLIFGVSNPKKPVDCDR
jgi:hypothetical protein